MEIIVIIIIIIASFSSEAKYLLPISSLKTNKG